MMRQYGVRRLARRRRVVSAIGLAAAIGVTTVAFGGPGAGAASPPKPAAYGTIWALNTANEDSSSITEYAAGANHDATPIATISGPHTGLVGSDDVIVTPSGALWVSESDTNSVDEFAPGASGDATPEAVIAGSKTGLDSPTSLTLGHDGSLWVMNNTFDNSSYASISRFAPGAHGNVAPKFTIVGPKTNLYPGIGIALTPDQKHIWVTNISNLMAGELQEYSTAHSGNVAPVATIAGAKTQIVFPYGLLINSAGDIIVASDINGDVGAKLLTFAPTAHGNAAPIRTIVGPDTGVTQPSYMSFDARGNLWAPNYGASTVVEQANGAKGDAKPLSLISGADTGLAYPNAVAVRYVAPGAPGGLVHGPEKHRGVTLKWKAPRFTGGGLLGYAVFDKRLKHAGWKLAGHTTKRSLRTHRLTRGSRYRFEVVAINEAGTSKRSKSVSIAIG